MCRQLSLKKRGEIQRACCTAEALSPRPQAMFPPCSRPPLRRSWAVRGEGHPDLEPEQAFQFAGVAGRLRLAVGGSSAVPML
eukprot:2618283-Pyramimonas_sp.AAC.1